MLLVTKTWVARLASLGRNTAEIENASLTSIELLSDLTAKALEDLKAMQLAHVINKWRSDCSAKR